VKIAHIVAHQPNFCSYGSPCPPIVPSDLWLSVLLVVCVVTVEREKAKSEREDKTQELRDSDAAR